MDSEGKPFRMLVFRGSPKSSRKSMRHIDEMREEDEAALAFQNNGNPHHCRKMPKVLLIFIYLLLCGRMHCNLCLSKMHLYLSLVCPCLKCSSILTISTATEFVSLGITIGSRNVSIKCLIFVVLLAKTFLSCCQGRELDYISSLSWNQQ